MTAASLAKAGPGFGAGEDFLTWRGLGFDFLRRLERFFGGMRAFFPEGITLRRAGWFDKQRKGLKITQRRRVRRGALRRKEGVVGEFPSRDKLGGISLPQKWKKRKITVSEHKQDEGFKVIDRRPFTAEGEIRQEVVEEQEREAQREEVKEKLVAQAAADAKTAAAPPAETPKKVQAFENLVRMIGSNAAMGLGASAARRTGEPVIDPEAARELIDMLDALHVKTKGNLAPEEDSMLLDLLGKLKMTYLEINKAMAAQMAQVQGAMKGERKQ